MIEFPSFEAVPESPRPPDPGVAAAMGATVFARGEPVALHGSFLADGALLSKCGGNPMSWAMVIVVARDLPQVWAEPVVEGRPTLAAKSEGPAPSPSFRVGGHFNLDLREHLGLPDEPGRYWVLVSLGEHLTDRIAFELM